MNNDIYQTLKQFINTSETIEAEEKLKYLSVLENLSKGKVDDLNTAEKLSQFLEKELTRLEDAAIRIKDTELISSLADLRNARLELVRQLLGITEA